jgi:hypothetical protein
LGVGYALTVAFGENDLRRYAVHSNAVRTCLGGDDLSEDLDARLSSGIGLRGATAVAPDFVREKDRLRYERQAGLIRLLEEKSALRPELTAAAARATSFGHSPAMIFIVVWWWSAGGALIVTKNGLAIRSCSLC